MGYVRIVVRKMRMRKMRKTNTKGIQYFGYPKRETNRENVLDSFYQFIII